MALNGSTNAEKIFDYLVRHGLTEIAAYGLMGNIQAESGYNPWNLQNSYENRLGMNDATYTACVDNNTYLNFATDKAGYGLCQWTSSGRKNGLLRHAKSTARSIGDMEMQLEWLMYELESGYKSVLSSINAAKSIREASDIVLKQFERPADQSEAVQSLRAKYGETIKSQLSGNTGTQVIIPQIKTTGADSQLVSVVNWSDKNYGTRTSKITGVTIHHMAGDSTIEGCMAYHKTCTKKVSANYYIGSDGRIGQAVPESKGAWTSSNRTNDMQKVTIEVANCATGGLWPVSDAAYNSLVALVVDICKRNDIGMVNYTGDKNGIITEHRMFSNTVCPGASLHDFLTSGKLVNDVNSRIGSIEAAKYDRGVYITKAGPMKIRKGPGLSYSQKDFREMTISAQEQNSQYAMSGKAFYKKGIAFTALKITQAPAGTWWAQTPSGWICLADQTKEYCSKR